MVLTPDFWKQDLKPKSNGLASYIMDFLQPISKQNSLNIYLNHSLDKSWDKWILSSAK